jgi:hypothetical protein
MYQRTLIFSYDGKKYEVPFESSVNSKDNFGLEDDMRDIIRTFLKDNHLSKDYVLRFSSAALYENGEIIFSL